MGVSSHDEILKEIQKLYVQIEQNEFKGSADGRIDMDVVPCSCKYDPDQDDRTDACGDESCINRFVRRQYANFEVFKTEKKGGQFVIEYCGEVIPASMFSKRAREYSEAGAKHFYFMSLKTDEVGYNLVQKYCKLHAKLRLQYIDAYKKGNLARFMNHSCDPNCELQKWVVGSQMRMGMFTRRAIEVDEELTFDYKFERYGSEPQQCYCESANCKGVIGGTASKSSSIRNLDEYDFDIEDETEVRAVTKPRRTSNDDDSDEDYMKPSKPSVASARVEKGLQNPDDIPKFVKAMLYTTSKKSKLESLLRKLEATESIPVLRKFLQAHGLPVLRSCLAHYLKTDSTLCHRVLRICKTIPAASRNSIVDSKIEDSIIKLKEMAINDEITSLADELLEGWAQLPTVYKIPKRLASQATNGTKRTNDGDGDGDSKRNRTDRNEYNGNGLHGRRDSQDKSSRPDFSKMNTPAVFHPRPHLNRKNEDSFRNGSPFARNNSTSSNLSPQSSSMDLSIPATQSLPTHWKSATTEDGKVYYYNSITRQTTWEFPNETAEEVKARSSIMEGVSEADINAILEQALASANGTNDGSDGLSKAIRAGISEIVVKTLSKYKRQLTTEKFKKMARKITHQIMEKESKNAPTTVTDEMKAKIKKFTKNALISAGVKVEKEAHHSKEKDAHKKKEEGHKRSGEGNGHKLKHDERDHHKKKRPKV
ncbi:histone methyltransferase set2 [Chytridiales sp. JEL 0842]|nr:histone methyltransferase set2 [Chytridiales sp. JEL 0842]